MTSSILDGSAPEPLYNQLRLHLLGRIEAAEFGPGDRIPTEMELCEEYGVSRSTARQALQLLAADDVLIRARRRGTIVSPSWRSTAPSDEMRLVISDSYREDEIRTAIPSDRNVKVTVVAYDEMRRFLLRATAEGRAPDVAMIDHVWVAEFARMHMIHSLHHLDAAWADETLRSSIHPAVATGYLFADELYAIPEEVNLAGVWYDTVALFELGAAIPSTWEDLLAVATALKELDAARFPIAMPGGQAARETTSYCVAALLASNGAAIIDRDVVLDSSAAVGSLRFLRRLIETGLVSPSVVDADWLEAPRKLGTGEAAITFGGSYETEHIAASAAQPVESLSDRFVFRPFPAGPHGAEATVIGGMGYAIFKQAADPYSALDLVKSIAASSRLDARSIRHGTISPTGAAGSLGTPDQSFIGSGGHILESATTRPVVPTYAPVTRQIQRMVQAVIEGAIGPAAAAERTAEFIGAVTDLPVVHR
jgi:ABC-type glycerol-3-phosphate transport system substrate-binding protein